MKKKKVIDVTGSEEFGVFFKSLSNTDPFKLELRNVIKILKENCTSGQKVEHAKWPDYYKQNYRINNLWRYELEGDKRLMYTIISSSGGLVVSILESFSNHTEYDKRMGY